MVEYTVKEYAWLEHVSDRQVRRWIDKGAVTVRRTPGGGIRILLPARHPADRRHLARVCEGDTVQSVDVPRHLSR